MINGNAATVSAIAVSSLDFPFRFLDGVGPPSTKD
jgi:hypothetical protein